MSRLKNIGRGITVVIILVMIIITICCYLLIVDHLDPIIEPTRFYVVIGLLIGSSLLFGCSIIALWLISRVKNIIQRTQNNNVEQEEVNEDSSSIDFLRELVLWQILFGSNVAPVNVFCENVNQEFIEEPIEEVNEEPIEENNEEVGMVDEEVGMVDEIDLLDLF